MSRERDPFRDVERLQELRDRLGDLAASCLSRIVEQGGDSDESIVFMGRMIDVVDKQSILAAVCAICNVAYWAIEELENKEISGFLEANAGGEDSLEP